MHVRSFTDHLHRQVTFSFPPKRIVSLVPSQTELLFDLGLHNEVAGITKFCIHPAHWQRDKTIIGGTKNFWFDTIVRLNPDLIIGNKEENYEEGVEELRRKYPVWLSDIVSFESALNMIRDVGALTNKERAANEICAGITASFANLKIRPGKKTLYLIWKNPWMAAGTNTFINTMLEKIGLTNCLATTPRYPELTTHAIKQLAPELILLSSEPFPFQEKHKNELLQLLPDTKIMLVDGEMFSWYGSRLIKAPEYLNALGF